MTTTYYSSYGLNIQSDLPLPELQPAGKSAADVKIQFGQAPRHLPNATAEGRAWQATANQMLLNIDNVARYWITSGNTITIDPYEKCQREEDLRAFLFGSVWGALLHQRGFLTLHASAISTKRGAVLFSGHSGAGKSTLAAAMEQKGYALISDDKTAITFNDAQQPIAIPAYPSRRLWQDSAERLGKPTGEAQKLRTNLNKYVSQVENFCTSAQPVHTLYLLHRHNHPTIEHKQHSESDSFAALLECTYRKDMLYGLGGRASQFNMTAMLANAVRVIELRRPATPFLLDELVDFVQEQIE